MMTRFHSLTKCYNLVTKCNDVCSQSLASKIESRSVITSGEFVINLIETLK